MTRPYFGNELERTPFSLWIRNLDAPLNSRYFDCQNLDYVWFNYREGWFKLIEEKRYGGQSTRAQSDTHRILAQMLDHSSGMICDTLRGRRRITFNGYYVVTFENTTPEDSAWVEINGTRYQSPIVQVKHLLQHNE